MSEISERDIEVLRQKEEALLQIEVSTLILTEFIISKAVGLHGTGVSNSTYLRAAGGKF